MCPPISTARSDAPAQRAPLVARLRRSPPRAAGRRASRAATRAPLPGVRPGDALRAVLVAGQLAQLLQLGDGSRGIERHGAMLTALPRSVVSIREWRRWPSTGRRHRGSGRCTARGASRSSSAGIAVFWGLWEGYRWIGEIARDHVAVRGQRDEHAAHPRHAARVHAAASAGRAAADPATSGTGRCSPRRRRCSASRSARSIGFGLAVLLAHSRIAAARPAAVHRRVADRADPRGRADGGRRPGDEGRHALGRGLRDRRLPDLLPGRDEHAARPALARPARPRADALLRGRPPLRCSGSCACPPRCRSSSRRSRSRRPRA